MYLSIKKKYTCTKECFVFFLENNIKLYRYEINGAGDVVYKSAEYITHNMLHKINKGDIIGIDTSTDIFMYSSLNDGVKLDDKSTVLVQQDCLILY